VSKKTQMYTVGGILCLNAPHLFLNFLHADLATEDGSDGQISSLSRIGSSHHVLCIKHLLSQLGDAQCAELMTSTRSQGSKPNHEEMQTREGNHVDGKFSEVRVELPRKTETSGHTRHDGRDEVIEISVGRGIEFEGADADIIQRLVVNAESLVRVLDELL